MDNLSWFYVNNDWIKVKILEKNQILLNGNKVILKEFSKLKPINIGDISIYNNLMSIPHLNEPALLEAIK